MRKNPWILLLSVLFLNLIVSCTEKADLDPKERFIQVYAILENTDVQKIMLHYTSYISESLYLPVEKADVLVEEYVKGEKRNSYVFEGKGNGEWTSEFRPVPRAEYRLYVDSPGFPVMRSVAEYPDTLSFISYEVRQYPEEPLAHSIMPELCKYEYKKDSCIIWIYYEDYIPEKRCREITDSTAVGMIVDVAGDDDGIYSYDSPLWMPKYDMFINASWSALPEMLYYDKYKRYHGPGRCEAIKRIPFSAQYQGPYLKLFGFHVHSNTQIVFNGREYWSSNPMWQNERFGLKHPESYIMLQSVDEGYDRYLRETYAFELGLDRISTSDLTFLWDYKDVYSNIENGVGILGGAAKCKLHLKDYKGVNETPIWDRFDIVLPE